MPRGQRIGSGLRGCSCTELWRPCRECCATVDEQYVSFLVSLRNGSSPSVRIQVSSPFVVCFTTCRRLVFREGFLTTSLITRTFATVTFSVCLLPAVEALNIFVWVLLHFPWWAPGSLLALLLALDIVTLLALAFPFAVPLSRAPVSIGCAVFISVPLVSIMLRTSSQTECASVGSAGEHHEVVRDIRVFFASLHECHFQRLRQWCSRAGFVLLDEENQRVE